MMDSSVKMDISPDGCEDELNKYRNKEDGEKSAVASHAVRQHLANFILSRRPSQDQADLFRSSSGNIISDIQLEEDLHLYEPRSKSSFTGSNHHQSSYRDNEMVDRYDDNPSHHHRRYDSQMRNLLTKKTNDHYVQLRKTASLPTMLLSLKTQASSRRRQLDRRTTMSPIIKRKVKQQRRAHLEQTSSSSTEYSSNPSLDQSIRAAVMVANAARSPTPPLLQHLSLESTSSLNTTVSNFQKSSTNSNNNNSFDAHQLVRANNNNDETCNRTNNPSNHEKLSHMRVNQALRTVVIQRATSKGKIIGGHVGGSFDQTQHHDRSTSMHCSNIMKQASAENNNNNNNMSIFRNKNNNNNNKDNTTVNMPVNKQSSSIDEPRLFGPQARDLATAGRPLQAASQAHFQIIEQMATNESESNNERQQKLTQKQQHPNMNTGSLLLKQIPEMKPATAGFISEETRLLLADRLKNRFSSSSSSISSLFSQKYESSMEDAGSQPIDLSSQSQLAANNRQQDTFNNNPSRASVAEPKHIPLASSLDLSYQQQQQYHKILQESFNQLQLRQSHENMALLQSVQQCDTKLAHNPARLLMKSVQFGASRDVSSLDNPKSVKLDHVFGVLPASSSSSSSSAAPMQPQFNNSASECLLPLVPPRPLEHGQMSRDELSQLLAQYHDPNPTQTYGGGADQSQHNQAQSFELFNRWLSVYSSYISQQQNHQLNHQQTPSSANWSPSAQLQLANHSSNPNDPRFVDNDNNMRPTHQQHELDSMRLRHMLDLYSSPGQLQQQLNDHQQSCQLGALNSATALAGMDTSSMLAREALCLSSNNQHDRPSALPGHLYRHRLQSMARTLSSPILVSTGPVSSTAGTINKETGLGKLRPVSRPNLFHFDPFNAAATTREASNDAQAIVDMQVDDEVDQSGEQRIKPTHDHDHHDHHQQQHEQHHPAASITAGNSNIERLETAGDVRQCQSMDESSSDAKPATSGDNTSKSVISETGARTSSNVFCSMNDLNALRLQFEQEPSFNANSSTGVTFDRRLCNHRCICGKDENHPENAFRVLAIWSRLLERGLLERCARVSSREATFDEIKLIHGSTYACYFGLKPEERIGVADLDLSKLRIPGLIQLECGGQGVDVDTFWNERMTPDALRLAVGSVIESVSSVARGQLLNSFAIVRPPGLHAEADQTNGFCFFNSLAIAAKILTSRFHLKRVLIIDWDVHHGNGIQKAFYEDQKVVYISLHRHDRGAFFPGTGALEEFGQGQGTGYNWNVAWSDATMADAEYLAAFRSIVMPIARDFDPSMVLVACGFDAASGHPQNFGGYNISAACFAVMTRQLMTLANGRIVLCLEGGFQLNVICECAEACLRTLLNDKDAPRLEQISETELTRKPCPSAQVTMRSLATIASKFWPSVEKWFDTIDMSVLEAANYNH